jgi:4-amino-4-deoxy-L-arabinose transferase-like glycosyltransferase
MHESQLPPAAIHSPRSRIAKAARSAESAWLPALVVLIAAGLRLVHYVGQPTLWLDEARIALNVAGRSWGGLLRPLDYDQSAPPLFLWLEKLAIGLGGPNELALRAPALLAGVLSVDARLGWRPPRVR